MNSKFNVQISGQAYGGKSRDEAIAALARYAGIELERAEAMFARAPAVVKRDVPLDLAQSYQKKLRDLGIDAAVAPAQSAAASSAGNDSVAPASAAPAQASVTAERADAGASTAQRSAPAAPVAGGAGAGDGRGTDGSGSVAGKRHVGFVFTGEGYEYFKIWIVNILLTIVTLGIYAPWAKVRNAQYFYGNTSLDGASFAFTADPVKMLIGRLIALGLLVAFMVLNSFSPVAGALTGIGLVFVFPWILNRTFAFYARNSTYRNIRFRFVGKYVDAMIAYLGWPILAAITLGLLSPLALYKQKKYVLENHRYGNQSFSFRATAGNFYKLCLTAVAIAIIGIAAGAIVGMMLPLAMGVFILLGYAAGILYFVTNMNNLVFNNLSLSSHDFKAKYEMKGYGWLMVSNFVLTLLTLGLFIPWAKVRLAHYAAEHTAMDVTQDLDKFAAVSQPDESAFGEEFGDVFDMEVGF